MASSTTFLFMLLTASGNRVKGDATEKHFEKQIALDSIEWEFEVKQQDTDSAQDAATRKMTPIPRGIKLTKAFDRSTTNLCNLMNTDKPFDTAVIKMLKGFGGDRPRTLIDITLTKGKVTKVDLTASESDRSVGVKETVELSFEELKIEYRPDAETGQGDGGVTTFDLKMPSQGH
jgi:type VI protein secretion system component Hcp